MPKIEARTRAKVRKEEQEKVKENKRAYGSIESVEQGSK
jgi:hypothetical protein